MQTMISISTPTKTPTATIVLDPGEDLNNNGRLDLGEDANRNGQIDIVDRNNNGLLDPGDDYRNTDRHAFFRYETMNRLTNVATVRSNVFAVWVTIGFSTRPRASNWESTPRNHAATAASTSSTARSPSATRRARTTTSAMPFS